MFNSINTFDIRLNNLAETYAPGSLIAGQVILDLEELKSFRALKLRFEGVGKIQWGGKSSGDGRTKNTQTESHTEKEEYFRTDVCLYGNINGDSVDLPAGYHAFSFSFVLPQDIPNTFEHTYGHVKYTLKAIIDRPWRFDHEVKLDIIVETPLLLDSSRTLVGVDDETLKSFCCILMPCANQGDMTIHIRIPRVGYVCGEYIKVMIDIDSHSNSVDVTRIKLALEQTLLFHSSSVDRQKNVTKTINETENFGPFSENIREEMKLQIPNVPLSFLEYCNIIDIDYHVVITVYFSGCHCTTKKYYDILIGSIPTIKLPEQEATTSAPDYYQTNYSSTSSNHYY